METCEAHAHPVFLQEKSNALAPERLERSEGFSCVINDFPRLVEQLGIEATG
jgi:hypothetical protein